MAFIEISRLPETLNLDSDSVIPVVYQGETKKISFENLKSLMQFFQSASYNKITGVFTFGLSDDSSLTLNSGLNKSVKDLSLNNSTLTITYQDDTTDTLQLPTQDLTGYVKNTDYATVDTGGVIKANSYYALSMYQGNLYAQTKTNEQYSTAESGIFISKGTLDNVLTAIVGDISTILQTLDTGSGV